MSWPFSSSSGYLVDHVPNVHFLTDYYGVKCLEAILFGLSSCLCFHKYLSMVHGFDSISASVLDFPEHYLIKDLWSRVIRFVKFPR